MKVKFGTDGFRGVIGKDFTFDTALNVAMMALEYFFDQSNSVAVGYDTRFLSKEVSDLIAKEAAKNGYLCYKSETFCPSPALSLFTNKNNLNFGIMITASHNPPIFNGVKIKEKFGGSALAETMKNIANIKLSKKMQNNEGAVKNVDMKKFYINEIKKYFDLQKLSDMSLKILVNPMFGATSGYMTTLFKGSNLKVKEINSDFNPAFGGLNPEPVEDNLLFTKTTMKNSKYDVAFAFDGDGDRIACFDENANYYSSQKLLPLFLHYLVKVKKQKGVVVKTVSTSSMLIKVAEINSLPVKEVPIGFKNIVPFFLKGEALIGGEESGGIAMKGYIPERDGIFCALTLLEVLRYYKKTLSEIWAELESQYGTFVFKREDYHFEDELNVRKMLDKIDFDTVLNLKVKEKNFIDGRKFIFSDDSFLLIRVSGTEPVVRVYVECGDEEKLSSMLNWTKKFLKEKGVSC